MPNITKFGEKVRELRNSADLSLRELSKRTGISHSQLSKIETGMIKNIPDEETLDKLAYGLNVAKDELKMYAGMIDSDIMNDVVYSRKKLTSSIVGASIGLPFGILGATIGGIVGSIVSDSKRAYEDDDFTDDERAFIEAEVNAAYRLALRKIRNHRMHGGGEPLDKRNRRNGGTDRV